LAAQQVGDRRAHRLALCGCQRPGNDRGIERVRFLLAQAQHTVELAAEGAASVAVCLGPDGWRFITQSQPQSLGFADTQGEGVASGSLGSLLRRIHRLLTTVANVVFDAVLYIA